MTPRRWIVGLAGALVVSLGLNLFAGGLLFGRHLAGGPVGGMLTGEGIKVGIERLLRALPDADRELVRRRFEGQRADIRQKVLALADARRSVGAALRADPFDAAAFAAAYETMQSASRAVQDAIHAVVKQAAAELSPAGRTAIAEARWRRP